MKALLVSFLVGLAALPLAGLARADAPAVTARCTVAVVPFNPTRRVARPLVELIDRTVSGKLEQRGCQLVEAKAVTAMKSAIRFPRRPQAAAWERRGKGLRGDIVVGDTVLVVPDDSDEAVAARIVINPAMGGPRGQGQQGTPPGGTMPPGSSDSSTTDSAST
jgi:hypothetical protein